MTHENCEALEAADNEKKCVSDLKEEAERLTLLVRCLIPARWQRGGQCCRIGVSTGDEPFGFTHHP